MADIVERLRASFLKQEGGAVASLPYEAADEIERLRVSRLELLRALKALVGETGSAFDSGTAVERRARRAIARAEARP